MKRKNPFYKLLSVILVLSALTALFSSCNLVENVIYNDKPLPVYDYPEKVYTYNLASSVGLVENDNEEEIRDLIDMINNCKFREVEVTYEDLDTLRSYYFVVDKNKILPNGFTGTDFSIYNEGKYLRVSSNVPAPPDYDPDVESTDTLIVYEVIGFDMSVAMPFLEGIYWDAPEAE